jgi:hypothetical protein
MKLNWPPFPHKRDSHVCSRRVFQSLYSIKEMDCSRPRDSQEDVGEFGVLMSAPTAHMEGLIGSTGTKPSCLGERFRLVLVCEWECLNQ